MDTTTLKVSLVLAGQFAPDNFHPDKLAEGGAIAQEVAKSSSMSAYMPLQTVQFKWAWAELAVFQSKLQITSLEAPHIRVRDLLLKELLELSPGSIVTQFGIDVDYHHDFGSFKARNDFERRIAPLEAWGAWGETILASMEGENCGTALQGGPMGVHLRLPFIDGLLTGWRDVMVLPSPQIKTGVLIRSNHHHQLANLEQDAKLSAPPLPDDKATSLLLTALSSRFEKSIDEAASIFGGVIP